MTPFSPPQATARVLPFAPRPLVGRSSWPFPVAREGSGVRSIREQAARVIATTVQHWQPSRH